MEKEQLYNLLVMLYKICNYVNEQTLKDNPQSKLRYEVLRFSDISEDPDILYMITEFYNKNWTGNKDFMHIPDFNQVLTNALKYPIIIAREEGKNEILAISTIKYDENTNEHTNPYFPEANSKFFSITGVLVKHESPYKGLGKKIYEIAIRGLYDYNKENPNSKIMIEIDCRNKKSIMALQASTENLFKNNIYGEGKELPAHIVGYYLLKDKENGTILEAPTLIFVIDLVEQEKEEEKEIIFTYSTESTLEGSLFQSLANEINNKCTPYSIKKPEYNFDRDTCVEYYRLEQKMNIHGLEVEPNETDSNNDRMVEDISYQPQEPNTNIHIEFKDLNSFVTVGDIARAAYKVPESLVTSVEESIRKFLNLLKGSR